MRGPRGTTVLMIAALALAGPWIGGRRAAGQPSVDLGRIRLPPGFRISLYATGVADARSMTLGDAGTLFVGTRNAGTVYAVRDLDADDRAEQIVIVARGLDAPNGVAFLDGDLYVAEVGRVLRFDAIESRLDAPPTPVVVRDDLPADRTHGWRYLRAGPDGRLYFQIGAPCNVCERSDPRFATIVRMSPDGGGLEVYARGVRNSVGFDWDPRTGDLWFTDNGRDGLGDEVPPDELNHAPTAGLHFGFPYCHGGDLPDPQLGSVRPCDAFEPPAQSLGAHVAALGMRFYTGLSFPAGYRNQIVVAEHGSWDRSVPTGYRIVLIRLEGNRVIDYDLFAEGWLDGGSAWGRPVDLLVMPDGALLVSDDRAGVIYRIAYGA
jgi:glucose/arabinose dehydrogenase